MNTYLNTSEIAEQYMYSHDIVPIFRFLLYKHTWYSGSLSGMCSYYIVILHISILNSLRIYRVWYKLLLGKIFKKQQKLCYNFLFTDYYDLLDWLLHTKLYCV